MSLAGGKSAPREISPETATLVQSQRGAIEKAAGVERFDRFDPVSERSQVAGTNHFVKIRVGDTEYLHAVIWTKPWEQFVQVTDVHTGKTEQDPL